MDTYDAIILLGGGIKPDGTLMDTARTRVVAAAGMFKQGTTKNLVVCGSHGYKANEKPALGEAEAFALELRKLDIPEHAIYTETESQDTLGNVLFVKMHILPKHDWRNLLVIPCYSHSTERIRYILRKILGADYDWEILRVGEDTRPANLKREITSLELTREINDRFADGDHEAIYEGLKQTHPAYGGTKWTVEELREQLGDY